VNERTLFQLAARTALGPEAGRRLAELLGAGELDWALVLREGGRSGILPLLALHLRDRPEVPEEVRTELSARRERIARSNLYLTAQLLEVAEALERRGVPVIALKGPAVAATLYSDLSLREFGDLDLLVRRADVATAFETVRELGFEPWKHVSDGQRAALERVEYSRAFTRPSDDLDLDLHWDVTRSFFAGRVQAEELWDATSRAGLLGRSVRSLPLPYLLVALCVHGAKHGPFPWPRVKWICDVAELIRGRPDFDWQHALELARALRCERMVLLGLALASPLVDDELPPPAVERLEASPPVRRLAARIWDWLVAPADVHLSLAERAAVDLTVVDRRRDRAAYAWRRLWTPTHRDWETARLPRGLAFLYLPLRILRLTGRYALAPARLRRLAGGSSTPPGERRDPEPGAGQATGVRRSDET
jgi:hypothetical protein